MTVRCLLTARRGGAGLNTVDAAVWGVIGTLIGGLLTILGQVAMHANEQSTRKREQDAAARVAARDERKNAYTRLLTIARKLRYIARDPTSKPDRSELNALRTELSTVQYEIELIAPTALVIAANNVRRATLDYLNESMEDADPGRLGDLRVRSREAVGALISAAREDLAIAPDKWPEVQEQHRR